MAVFEVSRPVALHPVSFISDLVSNVVNSVVSWNKVRQTRNALSSLSTRELADIGLTYADIEFVSKTSR